VNHVLVVNAGSSSLKYSLVNAETEEAAGSGLVERIGEVTGRLVHNGPGGKHTKEQPVAGHQQAMRLAIDAFDRHGPSLSTVPLVAIGHRLVHGGDKFSAPR
jgi:acetate kinase